MNIKEIIVKELHKPARRNFPRRHVDMRGIDETWQADLVDMSAYSTRNKGHNFLLTIIDIFSKYAWAVPLKTKSGPHVTQAMETVFKGGRVPRHLHVDEGKEFYNKDFQALMKKHTMKMNSTFSGMKASICERFNRTLKEKMWKQFSLRGNYKWLDIINDLVENYNNSKHRTISMRPVDVTKNNEQTLLKKVYRKPEKNKFKHKYEIGDKVRISKYKHIFEKGYTPNWTTEIFTITAIKDTRPFTYRLQDYRKQPIRGGFYEEELLKVEHPDAYLVEKVLRKRGKKVYVKWLGFDNEHNSWINASEL